MTAYEFVKSESEQMKRKQAATFYSCGREVAGIVMKFGPGDKPVPMFRTREADLAPDEAIRFAKYILALFPEES